MNKDNTKIVNGMRFFRTACFAVVSKLHGRVYNSDSCRWCWNRLPIPSQVKQKLKYVFSKYAIFNTTNVIWEDSHAPKTSDPLDSRRLPIKTIVFYTSPFYSFRKNSAWRRKGLIEWTNVSNTQPQYLGHYQPRLPGELGFYDSRSRGIIQQQVGLARHYGIYGFCFQHYWFDGKRSTECPVDNLLTDPTLDINFCLSWADENRNYRRDGSGNDARMMQSHLIEDDVAFFKDVLPALQDPRYIRISDKPVLIVDKASVLLDAADTAERWRVQAVEHGLPGLFLVAALSSDIVDPRLFGFDALVEAPPQQTEVCEITNKFEILNPDYHGKIFDYSELAADFENRPLTPFLTFKTVVPSWDDEAREPGNGRIFHGAKPQTYARWLTQAACATMKNEPDKRLLFINAWNEWERGAYLEPDRHYGYAYLHATANVLRNLPTAGVDKLIAILNQGFRRRFDTVLVLHLYYEDLIDPIFGTYISQLQCCCDLITTVKPDCSTESLKKIKEYFPNVYFLAAQNRGRDIRPFLQTLSVAIDFRYSYFCKIHTKKSPHRVDGAQWRTTLFDCVLGSAEKVNSIISLFRKESRLGLLVPAVSETDLSKHNIHIGNKEWLDTLLTRMSASEKIGNYAISFPAGSMYWGRIDAVRLLLDPIILSLDEFELETGQLDGTLAHAIERLIELVVEQSGYISREIC